MKKIYIILIVFLFALNSNAQQDPQYTQYMYNMNVLNPAYAGTTEGLAIGVLYRSQWAGLDGGPRTFTFAGHAPIGERTGLGLSLISYLIFFLINYWNAESLRLGSSGWVDSKINYSPFLIKVLCYSDK